MERRTTVFADIARAKPKSQSCKDETQRIKANQKKCYDIAFKELKNVKKLSHLWLFSMCCNLYDVPVHN